MPGQSPQLSGRPSRGGGGRLVQSACGGASSPTRTTKSMSAHPPTTPGPIPKARALGDDLIIRIVLPVDRSLWAIAAGYVGLFSVLLIPAPLALPVQTRLAGRSTSLPTLRGHHEDRQRHRAHPATMSSTRSAPTPGCRTSPRGPRRKYRRLRWASFSTSAISSSLMTPRRRSPSGRRTDQRRGFRKRRRHGPRGRCATCSPGGPIAAGRKARSIARRGVCMHRKCPRPDHSPVDRSMRPPVRPNGPDEPLGNDHQESKLLLVTPTAHPSARIDASMRPPCPDPSGRALR